MDNSRPQINKKYHVSFESIEYDFMYPEKDLLELICTNCDINNFQHDDDKKKIYNVNRFEISENIWCCYWHSSRYSVVQIEDWNRMVIDVIKTSPDLSQERDAGIISEI